MEPDRRPSPEELLKRIKAESKGKLTIFLGPAAGVGKTYVMLEAAHERLNEGVDVVIGWVETHGRKETESVLEGLFILPSKEITYKDRQFKEMDIDGILKRKPALVLVDELAHTNIPGSRHVRRFQDVEEILAAGINVYTTLNIQHVESLNDVVSQITGIPVRETVPDKLLDEADEIRLIDISADELIKRLHEGKVYIPEQARRAIDKFFRPGNINALRELALRYTALGVDKQLERYRAEHSIEGLWPAREFVLAALSSSPFSAQVARTAARLATAMRAQWIATYVETPGRPMSQPARDQLTRNLRLAEELGAQIVALSGNDVAEEILAVARRRNVTQIVIGQPLKKHLASFWRPSVVEKVINGSEGMSVYVIPGAGKPNSLIKPKIPERKERQVRRLDYKPYVEALAIIMLMTAIIKVAQPFLLPIFDLTNVALIYLLPVLYTATRHGRGPSIFAAVIAVSAFDFLFVPPELTFAVADLRYIFVFIVFLVVAAITGTLASRLRTQAEQARRREERTTVLYALSRRMAAETDIQKLLDTVVKAVFDAIGADSAIFTADESGNFEIRATTPGARILDTDRERAVAYWVFENGQFAGKGTETLAGSEGLYVPLKSDDKKLGALGVIPVDPDRMALPAQRRLAEAFAGLASLAIMRLRLTDEAKKAASVAESEKLRTALFNSVSHDLRTPLALISGAVSALEEQDKLVDKCGMQTEEQSKAKGQNKVQVKEQDKKQTKSDASPATNTSTAASRSALIQSIKEGANRMNRLVGNLLDTARFESGMLKLNKDWYDVQDIVGVSLRRSQDFLKNHVLRTDIVPDLPLVSVDFSLIEQVIVNLLHNAATYSPDKSEIDISVSRNEKEIIVSVADHGSGVPEADHEKIFDKFYRLQSPRNVSGTGLGLSICKGLIEAHGGRIWVADAKGGGSVFSFTLPVEKQPSIKEPKY
jgi:two-component system sensor histidine kinase KdpD